MLMSNNFYSVSRVEGNIAILETPERNFIEIDISLLPSDVKEGNILKKTADNDFIHDFNEENFRKQKLLELQNKIFG